MTRAQELRANKTKEAAGAKKSLRVTPPSKGLSSADKLELESLRTELAQVNYPLMHFE